MAVATPLLTGAGLRNHPLFPHPARQQGLTEGIVDLVRTRMVQVFPLQVDLRPAQVPRQALGKEERRFAPRIIPKITRKLGTISRVLARCLIGRLQFDQRGHEGFGGIAAAKDAEVPLAVGHGRQGYFMS